jgi:prepilin-type N-terminal cleavage/methylation domain-containing protein
MNEKKTGKGIPMVKLMNKHHQKNIRQFARQPRGFTLTEVMISILIVMVLATGAMGYQYNSTRDVKISEVQAAASRIAMLLLEGWKGQQGDTAFDPVDIFGDEMAIQTSASGPDVPDNSGGVPLTLLDSYEIVVRGVNYYVTLSYEEASASEPMLLNVTVAWRRDYTQGVLEGDERFVRYSTFLVSY